MPRKLIVEVIGDTSKLEKSLSSATDGTNKLGRSMSTGLKVGLAAVATGVGAVAVGIGASVKKAADFEQTLSAVAAASGATSKQMERLKEAALDLGASTSFSASEVASAQVELAKAGITVEDQLRGGLKGALDLAAAGTLELADAASFAANAMNLFGLEGKDVTHIADAFATAANTTTADVKDFGMALTAGGAAAKAAGLTFDETMVILTALAKAGVKNSDAGTSMKTALIQLLNPTSKQATLQKKLGLEFLDSAGKMKDLAAISEMLREKTEGMSKAQRLAAFATIAGTDGVRTLLALYEAGPQKIDAYTAAMAKQGVAASVAATLQDNFKGKMDQLGGAIETLQIRIGMKLLPVLTVLAEWLAKNVDSVTTFAAAAAGAAVKLLDTLVPAFAQVRGVAAQLVEWFKQNWPRIQQIVTNVGTYIRTQVIPPLLTAFTALKSMSQSVLGVIRQNWPQIQETFKAVWSVVGPILRIFALQLQLLAAIVRVVAPLLSKVLGGALKALEVVARAVSFGLGVLITALNAIASAAERAYNAVKKLKDLLSVGVGTFHAGNSGQFDQLANQAQNPRGLSPRASAAAGGGAPTINFNGPVYGDPRAIAQAVREEFVKMQRSGTKLGFSG